MKGRSELVRKSGERCNFEVREKLAVRRGVRGEEKIIKERE